MAGYDPRHRGPKESCFPYHLHNLDAVPYMMGRACLLESQIAEYPKRLLCGEQRSGKRSQGGKKSVSKTQSRTR
uniref:Uncharacterized protein n=1 Tax=Arion vulgaris TaxID=1028688 RepID=A0A0B7AYK1_9EUPU